MTAAYLPWKIRKNISDICDYIVNSIHLLSSAKSYEIDSQPMLGLSKMTSLNSFCTKRKRVS